MGVQVLNVLTELGAVCRVRFPIIGPVMEGRVLAFEFLEDSLETLMLALVEGHQVSSIRKGFTRRHTPAWLVRHSAQPLSIIEAFQDSCVSRISSVDRQTCVLNSSLTSSRSYQPN